jgi:hypothetical protein
VRSTKGYKDATDITQVLIKDLSKIQKTRLKAWLANKKNLLKGQV